LEKKTKFENTNHITPYEPKKRPQFALASFISPLLTLFFLLYPLML